MGSLFMRGSRGDGTWWGVWVVEGVQGVEAVWMVRKKNEGKNVTVR